MDLGNNDVEKYNILGVTLLTLRIFFFKVGVRTGYIQGIWLWSGSALFIFAKSKLPCSTLVVVSNEDF
tara:strand:+ start:504 stop:707 length:204 start_codon:yes stop_codon:yes gene_type:complete